MRAALMFLAVIAAATRVQAQVGQCPSYNTLNNIVYLADKHDCSMFWRCDAGKKILGQCPPGKHFSPSTSTCEDPSTAGCTPVLKSCTAGAPHEKCNYECSCSIMQDLETCPTTLVFPINLDAFLKVNTSACVQGPKDITMGSEQLGLLSTHKQDAKVGMCRVGLPQGKDYDYQHFADCRKWVRCNGAIEIVTDCPSREVYNPLGYCEKPLSTFKNCGRKQAPKGGCPTAQPLSSCPYNCRCRNLNGKCPAQFNFEATINITDSHAHSKCRNDPSLIVMEKRFYGSLDVKKSSAKFDPCPVNNKRGVKYVPDKLNCIVVHKCTKGKAKPISCPIGSQFDTRKKICDPKRTVCQPPVPQQTLPPPCPSSVTCTAGGGARVRHPTDCTLYCECVQRAPYLGACPPGQHFSELTQTCELPAAAYCQIRCSKLPVVKGGRWDPPQCSAAISPEKTTCNIVCDAGLQLQGSADVTCTSGGWDSSSGLNIMPSCKTIEEIAEDLARKLKDMMNNIGQQKAVMLFVLDESGSMEKKDFEHEKDFVEGLVTAFPLSQDRSAGVITFSGKRTANTDIGLQETSTCDFISQLRSIKYQGGFTDLAGALSHAYEEIEKTFSGSSKPITLIFIITDGLSETEPTNAAKELRDKGHIVFTIGVANYNRTQLEPLSSNHHKTGAKLFYGLRSFKNFAVVAHYLKTTYNSKSTLSCTGTGS